MITLTITYIALVQENLAQDGATIAFPKEGHGLEIFLGGQQLKSGASISLEVTENGGVPVDLGKTRGLPMRGRVLSIEDLADGGGPYVLRPDNELIPDLAQTILRVHGGRFDVMDPHTASQYRNETWKIRPGREQQVTDRVRWTLDTDAKYAYALIIDGRRERLSPDAQLEFTNDDQPKKYFYDNGQGEAELLDVHDLYKLVTPRPLKRPTPKTPYKGPFIPPGPAAERGAVVFGGGDLPLCPVGEP